MADSREDVVEKNIKDVEDKHGTEAFLQIITQCVKDISVTLAQLLDK